MADLVTKIGFDVSQASAAITALEGTLSGYNQSVDNLAKATQVLDKNQQANGVTMRFINAEGRELVATVEKINGVYQTTVKETQRLATADKVAAQAIKQISQAMKEQERETERVRKAQLKLNQAIAEAAQGARRYAAANSLLADLSAPFQNQIAQANPAQAIALNSAFDKVRVNIIKGKFTLDEFEQAFREFQRVGSSALVGLDKSVAGSVYNLNKSLQAVGTTGQNAGQKILLTWAGVARIFVVQQIHRFVSLLSNEFTRATKESINFSLRIAEIQTITLRSGKSFQDWTQDVRALSDAFGQSNTIVAEGIYQGLSNQVITAANNTEFLTAAMKLSVATAATFDDGVNILSSAINSYGLSTSESARISGVFFKTVELGRVRLSEMANDFGTIGPLAKKLGITFEETNAIISSLTRTGIRYNEVNTIISSIMNELIKPSKELKELFARLGVESGEAAIKTFGFAGFMKILSAESAQGTEHLGELFNNVRALRGIIGTTGAGLSEFENDLKALRENGVDDLAEGFNKIADTDAKKLQIELNKLKNFFEVDLGIAFQRTLVGIIQRFGGLIQIVGEAASTTAALVTSWALYRFTLNAGVLDIGKFIAAQRLNLLLTGQQVTLTNLATASLGRLRVAMSSANVYIALATITIGLWVKSMVDAEIAQAQLEQSITEFGNKLRESSEREIAIARKTQEERTKIISDGLQKSVTAYAIYLTTITQLADRLVERSKQGSQAAADAFKSYIDNITNQLRDVANKAESEVKRLENLRDAAQKNQNDIRAAAAKNQVDRNVNAAATPDEKAVILQQEIDKANQAIEAIIQKGKAASLEELETARVLAEQKEQYAQRLFELRLQQEQALSKEEIKLREQTNREQAQTLDKAIKAAEDRYKRILAGAKGGNVANLGIAEQREARALEKQIKEQKEAQKKLEANIAAQGNLVGVRQKAENEILAATQQRLDLEKQISAEAEKRRQIAEADAAEQKQKALNFDQAAEQFVKGTKAADKTDFKTTETDPAKIKADLDAQQQAQQEQLQRQKDALIEAATQAGIGGAALIELKRNVESEITRIVDQAAAERAAVEVKALQQQVLAATTAAKERFDAAKKAADEQIKINEEAEDEVVARYQETLARIQGIIDQTDFLPTDVEAKLLAKLKEAAETSLAAVQLQDANNTVAQNAATNAEALATFTDALNQLRDVSQEGFFGLDAIIGEGTVSPETIDKLAATLGSLRSLQTITLPNVAEASKSVTTELNAAEIEASRLKATLDAITPAAQGAGDAMGNTIKNTEDRLPALIARYEQLVKLLNQAAGVRGIPGVPRWHGGSMQFLAAGGRGFDQIPAMLAPNEFVVNQKQSMKHYTQLVALNSGRQPRNFAQGGNVTTVGDINITVQGGDNSQQTVRDIGRQLKRNIRLGRY